MKKAILILMVMVLVTGSVPLRAEHKTPDAPTPVTTVKQARPITVKVNGLVCSFCAQGIKKRFMALPVVQSVQVSLGKKTVLLELKSNMVLTDKTIEETVKEAGYNTVRIER